MDSRINRQWIYARKPEREVGAEHFELQRAPFRSRRRAKCWCARRCSPSIRPVAHGCQATTYRSVLAPGDVMAGWGVGEVVECDAEGFARGDLVSGEFGWQEFAALPASALTKHDRIHRPEHVLGVLGVSGLTAYFGVLDVGRPRPGETVLVSGAAGAVGSIAGQIACLAACRVVGTTRGAEKCAWLTSELGFDAAIDYQASDVYRRLKAASPKGIDVYFDNTGGEVLAAALARMNPFGRVVCCGNVSQYDAAAPAS